MHLESWGWILMQITVNYVVTKMTCSCSVLQFFPSATSKLSPPACVNMVSNVINILTLIPILDVVGTPQPHSHGTKKNYLAD